MTPYNSHGVFFLLSSALHGGQGPFGCGWEAYLLSIRWGRKIFLILFWTKVTRSLICPWSFSLPLELPFLSGSLSSGLLPLMLVQFCIGNSAVIMRSLRSRSFVGGADTDTRSSQAPWQLIGRSAQWFQTPWQLIGWSARWYLCNELPVHPA